MSTLDEHLIPAGISPERDMLLGYVARQRALVFWKLEGMDDTAARGPASPTGLSIPVIVAHLAWVERSWIFEDFLGQAIDRVRAAEFLPPSRPLTELVAAYREVTQECDAEIAQHDLEDVAAGGPFTLRWILLHLIEEIGRHLGHLDLLAELADGRTGEEP